MKSCYLCYWFHTKIEDKPTCGRHADNPIDDATIRTPESLRILKCYPTMKGRVPPVGRPTFLRAKLTLTLPNGKPFHVFPCCPSQADAFKSKFFRVGVRQSRAQTPIFLCGETEISFCPFCGWKLYSVDGMTARQASVVKTRRARKRVEHDSDGAGTDAGTEESSDSEEQGGSD